MAHIAIIGATGNVGRQMLISLVEQNIPVDKLTLYASKQSAGTKIVWNNSEHIVQALAKESIDPTIDFALFSAGAEVAKTYMPQFNQMGIRVIDNSSAFRQDNDVPLVVPEVNLDTIGTSLCIANPNCSTIQAIVPLKSIHHQFGLKRVTYTTYQAVSGSGQAGIQALNQEMLGKTQTFYPKAILGNVIPQIDDFLPSGYTKEEQKMIDETRKILDDDTLNVSATCVRVPVMNGHAVSVSVECRQAIDLDRLHHALAHQAGIELMISNYPTPKEVSGRDTIYVGRVRQDAYDPHTVHFWCVADNVRKGAATNAVQILNYLLEESS